MDYSFVDKLMLPGVGRRYSGVTSKGLIWLKNSSGDYFPNHYIRRTSSRHVILYCHGNGGTLGDFLPIVQYYYEWLGASIFSIEYPSYGPAEGQASESSVNDNLRTAYEFLVTVLKHRPSDVVLMGYSIGTGPVIQLTSELCSAAARWSQSPNLPGTTISEPVPPAAMITIAAFESVKDIIKDREDGGILSLLVDSIENRWVSSDRIKHVSCPSLFLHGQRDGLIPASHSRELFLRCGSLFKQLRICPKADHCNFDEPHDTVHPMAEFLTRVWGQQQEQQSRHSTSSLQSNTGGDSARIVVPAIFYECPDSIRRAEVLAAQRARARRKTCAASTAEMGCGGVAAAGPSALGEALNWMGEAGGSVYRGTLSTVMGAYIFVANKTSDVARGGAADDLGTDEPDRMLEGVGGAELRKFTLSSVPNPMTTNLDTRRAKDELLGQETIPRVETVLTVRNTTQAEDIYRYKTPNSSNQELALSILSRRSSKQAIAAIKALFAALNRRDIDNAVLMMDTSVEWRFDEQPKHVVGQHSVKQLLVHTLNKRPSLVASFTIVQAHQDLTANASAIADRANCITFQGMSEWSCATTNYCSQKLMRLSFNAGSIHLVELCAV